MGRLKKNKAIFFLGSFAELRKATVSFVMAGSPSVRLEQLSFQLTDFH